VRTVPDVPDVGCGPWPAIRASQQRRYGALAAGDPSLVPLASVPIQNPAAAARELERAASLTAELRFA